MEFIMFCKEAIKKVYDMNRSALFKGYEDA